MFNVIRALQPVTARDLTLIMDVRSTQVHSALQNLIDADMIEASDIPEGKLYRVKLASRLPLLQQTWRLALSLKLAREGS